MDFNLNFHPLDNLIKDKTSMWLEALVPFIDFRYKKLLIIYIKYKELTNLISALDDFSHVENCGFNCKASSIDDVINGLAGFMPKDFSDNILQIKKMLSMMQMMNQMEHNNDNNCHNENNSNDFSNISNLINIFSPNSANPSSSSNNHKEDSNQNYSSSFDMYESVMSILDQY